MIKTLIKKQLLELFSGYVIDRKTGKRRSKKGLIFYVLLLIFVFVSLGFAFFSMAGGLGSAILGYGFNWLYFALTGLLSVALGVFGSVFNTYAGLYLPKDNEFLLSLPISGFQLVCARTAGVYFISLLYSAWLWIPSVIAYWVMVPVGVCNVLFPILLTFVIGLFVSVLSCALGWVVALIASKAKGKSFLTVFLSLAVMIGYYVIYFRVVKSLGEIVNHLDEIGSAVRSWLHYVYLLGMAADGNVLSMLAVVGITLLLAAVCLFVLSKTFTGFALNAEKTEKSAKGKLGYKKTSVRRSLLRREFRHFTSLSVWMLNGGLGLLILPVVAIAAIVKGGAIRSVLSAPGVDVPLSVVNALPVFLLCLICLIVSTNCILSCSVSLEGKTLWILQTLPVGPWEILREKESMGILLNLFPTLFAALVLGVVCQLEILPLILLVLAAVIYVCLLQDLGLFLNLRHPDLNWTNPVNVVKQSFPVFINLFGGWLFCGIVALGGYFLCRVAGTVVTMLAVTVLFGVLWALLHRWLKTKGAAIFAAL